ncbi:MAG: hypothetical protein NTW86_10110 [Candidatus Sumerlaeota bacterium]|nr:hypothetical protein [Candidatus Sumerlaeota bacterium]
MSDAVSPDPLPLPESPLRRWFWRDEDPLWRWASGQAVRRWWRHPMAMALIMLAASTAIVGVVVAAYVRLGDIPADAVREVAAGICLVVYASLYIALFILVARRPFDILGRLGGPAMLRGLTLTAIPPRSLGLLLYWGSYRWAALPSLALLYGFGAITFLIMMGARNVTFWGMEPLTFLALAFWWVLKPPLDYAMNLAISWRLYFRTGRKDLATILSTLLVVIVFPAIGFVGSRFVLGLAIFWMFKSSSGMTYRLTLSDFLLTVPGFWLFVGLMAAAIVLTYVLARRRYRAAPAILAAGACGLMGLAAKSWIAGADGSVLGARLAGIAGYVLSIGALVAVCLGVYSLFRRLGAFRALSGAGICGFATLLVASWIANHGSVPSTLAMEAGVAALLLATLAVKAAIARRCYRKFLDEWDKNLAERFGDAA